MNRLRTLPRQLLAIYAGTIATRLGTFVVPYLTLYLSLDRGLPLSTTGRVIAAGGAGLLLGNIGGGWLADRWGCKPTVLFALAVNVVGVTALGLSLPSSTAYAVALAAALTGAGMYTPAANAWIAGLTTHKERPLAYTVNYICINVGMGLGPLLGGVLAAASFRWLFVGDVLTTLVCAAFIASAAPGHRPRSTAATQPRAGSQLTGGGRLGAPWISPSTAGVLAFCGTSFFVVAPLMGLEYAVPLLVGTVLDQPLVLVGLVYSINAACILALGLPIERMLQGRDPLLMMAAAGALWALGLAILAVGFSSVALLWCTLVWTTGEIVGSVVVPTYVSRHVAAEVRGRFLALPDAMRSLAAIVAPIVLGIVWEQHGVTAMLTVLVATPLVGAVLYAGAWLRRRLAASWDAAA